LFEQPHSHKKRNSIIAGGSIISSSWMFIMIITVPLQDFLPLSTTTALVIGGQRQQQATC
jgi:hypothetical protein